MKLGVIVYLLVYLFFLRAAISHDIAAGRPLWYVMGVDLPELIAAVGILIYGLNLANDPIKLLWTIMTPLIALAFLADLCIAWTHSTNFTASLVGTLLSVLIMVVPALRINYLISNSAESD